MSRKQKITKPQQARKETDLAEECYESQERKANQKKKRATSLTKLA